MMERYEDMMRFGFGCATVPCPQVFSIRYPICTVCSPPKTRATEWDDMADPTSRVPVDVPDDLVFFLLWDVRLRSERSRSVRGATCKCNCVSVMVIVSAINALG
jgi:hypothetical protein